MENNIDWKEIARINRGLKYISLVYDVIGLKLEVFYIITSFGRIKEARQERLLMHLKNNQRDFQELRQDTIEKVKNFLQRYIRY